MDVTERIRATVDGMKRHVADRGYFPQSTAAEIQQVLAPLLMDPEELFAVGMRRWGRPPESHIVYFDGRFALSVSHRDRGFVEEVHDHGNVNHVMVLAGAVDYEQFELIHADDQGHAELSLIRKERLERGDVGLVLPPPNDIHGLTTVEDGTWMLTALFCPPATSRRIYQPADHTYRTQDTLEPA